MTSAFNHKSFKTLFMIYKNSDPVFPGQKNIIGFLNSVIIFKITQKKKGCIKQALIYFKNRVYTVRMYCGNTKIGDVASIMMFCN